MTEPSINFCTNHEAMCVSAPNILASILHRATSKGENCFSWFDSYFLLQQQRTLLQVLQQAYYFLVVEEEFRIRRRNQRWAMLMFSVK